ncbi:MAG: hypothetical protein UY49_C0041G0002 [Microgenomates group bacterium GW2011_GWC1_49_7]|nr:MAG: hypothetical protein UY49_C0041G0002 [Microgenomates group bacterium GW2011_GWC1_49_7]
MGRQAEIIDLLFTIRVLSQPDLQVNGRNAWLGVGLFGFAEKQLFGMDGDGMAATIDRVAVAIDENKEVLFSLVLPASLFQKAAVQRGVPWAETRKRIAMEYLLSDEGRNAPQLKDIPIVPVVY